MNTFQLCSYVLLTLLSTSAAGQTVQFGAERRLKGHDGPIDDFAIAPSGKWMATVEGGSKDVYLWSLPDGKKIGVLDGPAGRHYGGLAISPDETEICLALGQSLIKWQTTKIAKPIHIPFSDDKDDIIGRPAYSNDNKLLVVGIGGRLVLWSREQGKPVITAPSLEMGAPEFSPSDRTAIGRSGVKGELVVFEIPNGKTTLLKKADIGYVSGLTFVDDDHVFTCGWGGFADLWDLKKGKPIFTIEAKGMELSCIAYHRKTGRLAIGTYRQGLKVWDVKGRKELGVLFPKHSIGHVGFSPAGDLLLATFSDPFRPDPPSRGELAIVELKN